MKKFKLYYDKDLEQDWLQKMSQDGWAFKNFFLGVYTFVPCQPGEYIYQIDLLDDKNKSIQSFTAFMEDIGVEVVAQWYRWGYLRKKADDGPFEMYTDIESKINQYNRIKNFFLSFLFIESICFIVEFSAAIRTENPTLWLFTALIGLICLAFLRIVWKCSFKIEQLKREK